MRDPAPGDRFPVSRTRENIDFPARAPLSCCRPRAARRGRGRRGSSVAALIKIRLSMPSQLPLVELVDSVSERTARLAGFTHGESLDLALAVREAVVNAIEHGNRRDPEKPVEVAFEVRGSRWRARVRDRGKGFDPAKAREAPQGRHVLEPFGRGILLMRSIADRVRFRYREGRGMEVVLVKGKEPPAA